MASREELYQALRNADAAGDADGARKLAAYIQSMPADAPTPVATKPQTSVAQDIKQGAGNLVAGAVRGAGSIGATILAPYDMAKDAIAGKGVSLESNRQRRADMDAGLQTLGAEPSSTLYQGGKLASEIAGTAGVGGALANGVRAVAPGLNALANSIATGGMRAGSTPGAMNMLARVTGGAVTGGASTALINPEDAGMGAAIGAAMPPAMVVAGKGLNALGRVISGPAVAPEMLQAVAAARDAGYVVPPSQAKPTLANRALEGLAGKITTAQNASARNQEVTNKLASHALGLPEGAPITKEALGNIRSVAGQAYQDISQSGPIISDVPFLKAANDLKAANAKLATDFPGLQNEGINKIAEMLNKPRFDSESVVEALKQLRFDGNANRISLDPATKALGRAQGDAAKALEDLVERNLTKSGNADLLQKFRDARQLVAKTHTVEKALNDSSGNVSANALARMLEKGKPLSGDLKQIASFAAQFPKAAQSVEKMGSLPQVSPLDFGGAGLASVVAGNPLMAAGLLARPAARAAVLSGPVQNRLATPADSNALARLLVNPTTEQFAYRSAPVIGR